MSQARILVLDDNDERAQSIVSALEFIGYTPLRITAVSALTKDEHKPRDWVAVILGAQAGDPPVDAFLNWLRADPRHPPLLLLEEHHGRQFGLHTDECWEIDAPLRYQQLADVLCQVDGKARARAVSADVPTGMTGNSPGMRRVRDLVSQVAGRDATVLIRGESGTGKELVARAIHLASDRANGPFVAINCGAIPQNLIEAELFGHERGAFTGAICSRAGRFEMAEGGTLFLDEIGDMDQHMQVKLLRVMQERSFERIGSTTTQRCNVRIIAATHRDLEAGMIRGSFREDLFYRLNVFPIDVPPLRERLEDLPLLVGEITKQLHDSRRGEVSLAPATVNALLKHQWPGNIRELSNLLERLAVLYPGEQIAPDQLPAKYLPAADLDDDELSPSPVADFPQEGIDLKGYMAEVEAKLIRQAMRRSNGVVAHAAELLSLRRTTLAEKLRKYDIDRQCAS
ncbi:MAG: Fis family transcriptional regulator [Salinisphaeraceae bacterium]|nr:Fis family transcriptional regulator [Salinisphaeraceae bacterium]